jgi:excisionase family DNA binding protein
MPNSRALDKKLQTLWLTQKERDALKFLSQEAGLNASAFLKIPITEYLAKIPTKSISPAKLPARSKKHLQITEPKYIRPDAAASRISVTPAYIYKLMADGSLPFYNLGRTRLIKVSDLDQLVESTL